MYRYRDSSVDATNDTVETPVICALILGSSITVLTSAHVYAQINGDEISTQWCENKKDELKGCVTDLMLIFFAPSMYTGTLGDFIDEGNALVAETAQIMIYCADYLTGTEVQMLRGMHSAAAFFVCTTDAALNTASSTDSKLQVANYFEPGMLHVTRC